MQNAYDDEVLASPGETRAREREAISRSIELMESAELAGFPSREAIVAVDFIRQLWTILIEDLASSENALPPLLRAQVISIGLWIMREAEGVSVESRKSFRPAIDISKIVREGLA